MKKRLAKGLSAFALACLVGSPGAMAQQGSQRPVGTSGVRLSALAVGSAGAAQQPNSEESRVATREKLQKLLESYGPKVNVAFRQSEKQPFNFAGILKEGLTNSDSMEIVIGVTAHETIGFRIYPHYKGSYVNVDRVKEGGALMRQLLQMTNQNFLFWGMDSSGDVFSGFTFTLESGFPEAAIKIVLDSIKNLDQFVGQMRPNIDGSSAPSSN